MNKCGLRNIQESDQQNAWKAGDKSQQLLEGNLVLCDYSESYNKVQNGYKDQEFEVINKHQNQMVTTLSQLMVMKWWKLGINRGFKISN